MNFTITVPNGSSNHGNPNLLCTPPQWTDYILFYFANYFAHAATIIATPGQGLGQTVYAVVFALLLPVSGVVRALRCIRRHPCTETDPLKRAARAGALCMVVKASLPSSHGTQDNPRRLEAGHGRIEHAPENQQDANESTGVNEADPNVKSDIITDISEPRPRPWWEPLRYDQVWDDTAIHGQYFVPTGYCLAYVPFDAPVEFEIPDDFNQTIKKGLSSSYNLPKLLISFVQAIWAIITLYRARGDQIQQYGYAAFGLTVAPYAFMSVMNIIGNLLTLDYSTVFLVRTPLMDEAESSGGFFASEFRIKIIEADSRIRTKGSYESGNLFLGLLCGLIPLVVIGGLSGFYANNSTSLERGFTMAWLVVGTLIGGVLTEGDTFYSDIRAVLESSPSSSIGSPGSSIGSTVILCVMYSVPAIGGMVMVGHMINEFGICTLLG